MAPDEKKRLPAKPVKPAVSEKHLKAKRGSGKFVKGLIIWLVLLAVVIAVGLACFYGFLGKYEELYQESLPYHIADNAVQMFAKQDVDGIWELSKDKISLSEFENDATVKKVLKDLISGKEFTYKQTEEYAEDEPEYYIVSGNLILAKLKLAEDETQKPPYGFKAWKIGSVEFYTTADSEIKITIPETYKLTLNGIEVSANYKMQSGIEPEENKYLKPYAELPNNCVYEIKGLYEEPVIKITDAEGKEIKAEKDKKSGEYRINNNSECDEKEKVEKFALSFTTDFANFISQDAGNYALDKYFPKNSKTLKDIKRNSSREWYTKHGKVDIKNKQIKEFVCYTKDIVYVEAYVEQHMEMFWGSKDREVVKTTARLYLAKIKGEWKVAGIRY